MTHNPLIIIPSPTKTTLNIVDANGQIEKQAWPVKLNQQALTDTLKNSLMKMMLLRKDAGFSDSMANIIKEAVEPLSCNPDGSKKYNVQPVNMSRSIKNSSEHTKVLMQNIVDSDELINAVGEENIYIFSYDMFGDTSVIAKNLEDFICLVKTMNNTDKVDVLCVSLGGTVLKAYLSEYAANNHIENVISIASFMNGASLIADAFENRFSLTDTQSLIGLLGEKGASLSSVLGMLPPDAVENTVKKSMDIITKNLLHSCTMMWACIPNNRFDAIYSAYMPKGSELDKKVSALHEYSVNLNANLKLLKASGVKFHQFCGYGKPLLPITENNAVSSDGIVDTALASFGANCASVDSEPNYFGCLFPDTTEFFRDEEHFSIHKNKDLIAKIAKVLG